MKPMVKRWLVTFLGLAIVAALVYYLALNWRQLEGLHRIDLTYLVAIYLINSLGNLISSKVAQILLRAFGTAARFWDMVVLQNALYLLSYLPFKGGTVFRAAYLKSRYGLTYKRFVVFYAYLTLLIMAAMSATALAALIALHSLAELPTRVVAMLLASILLVSLTALFAPLPTFRKEGPFVRLLHRVASLRKEVSGNYRAISVSVLLLSTNFLLAATRLGLIYASLGYEVHPADCIILGALAHTASFVNITPGALGVREAIIGAGAVVVGQPLELGILVGLIDRAVSLSWSVVVGGPCAVWLWIRFPSVYNDITQEADA